MTQESGLSGGVHEALCAAPGSLFSRESGASSFHTRSLWLQKEGGDAGRLGLPSLRDRVPTPYVLRGDPLSCCSPDGQGAMRRGGAAMLLKFLFVWPCQVSVAACRPSLLQPAGRVIAPHCVGSYFPDQRSNLHPCVKSTLNHWAPRESLCCALLVRFSLVLSAIF